jgi:hypothetical protein
MHTVQTMSKKRRDIRSVGGCVSQNMSLTAPAALRCRDPAADKLRYANSEADEA